MKKHSFKEVSDYDNDLHQLAIYEVTEGKLVMPPKSFNHMFLLQSKIVTKFNYYKKMIHDGECTYDFIKCDVLGRFGPFPREKNSEEDFCNYDKLTEYITEKDELDEKLVQPSQGISDIIGSFLDSIQDSSKSNIGIGPYFSPTEDLDLLDDLPPDFPFNKEEDQEEDQEEDDDSDDLPFFK